MLHGLAGTPRPPRRTKTNAIGDIEGTRGAVSGQTRRIAESDIGGVRAGAMFAAGLEGDIRGFRGLLRTRARLEGDIAGLRATLGNDVPWPNGYAARRLLRLQARPWATVTIPFVVLVHATLPEWRSTLLGGRVIDDEFLDFRFELTDGTKIPHQVEYHDPFTGELVAWVRVPSWVMNQDLDLHLYYGRDDLPADEENPAAVWVDTAGRWSFPSGTDADGSNLVGTVGTGDLIGPAAAFTAGQTMVTADAAWLDGHAGRSVTWVMDPAASMVAAGVDQRIILQGDPAQPGHAGRGLLVVHDAVGFRSGAENVITVNMETDAGTVRLETAADTQKSGPQVMHFFWQSGQLPRLFRDGVEMAYAWRGSIVGGGATINGVITGSTKIEAGFGLGVGFEFAGTFDELRIHAAALTEGQVKAEGEMLRRPLMISGISSEERFSDSNPVVLAMADRATANTNTPTDIDVFANDNNAASLQVSSPSEEGGTVSESAGKAAYTPPANFTGFDFLRYWAVGPSGLLSPGIARVQVAPGGGSTSSGAELPSPLRTVNVFSQSGLDLAINTARAGDRVVLSDGVYGDLQNLDLQGTVENPIVFTAENRKGAKWPAGFVMPNGAENVRIHGIDLRDTSGNLMRGRGCWVYRCLIRPKYNAGSKSGTVCLTAQGNNATGWANGNVIAYCDFELHMDPADALPGVAVATNGWAADTIHHCLRGRHDKNNDGYHRYLRVDRIRLIGGPTRAVYSAPNGEFIEDVEDRTQSLVAIYWNVSNIYGVGHPTKETIFDCKGAKTVYEKMHLEVTSSSGHIQSRRGFETIFRAISGELNIQLESGPGSMIHDVDISGGKQVRMMAGTVPFSGTAPLGHEQCKDDVIGNVAGQCQIYIGRQFGSAYTYMPINARIEGGTPDTFTGYGPGASATFSANPTSFTPIAVPYLQAADVGIDAPWVGIRQPDWG